MSMLKGSLNDKKILFVTEICIENIRIYEEVRVGELELHFYSSFGWKKSN